MTLIVLGTAAPTAERVEAAHVQFSRGPSSEELVVYGIVLVVVLVGLFVLGRFYLRMQYSIRQKYRQHLKELETEERALETEEGD